MRFRLLSADDIFISYSRKDAATYAFGLAFSPDGRTLASNTQEAGGVILWDVASRNRLRELVYPGLRADDLGADEAEKAALFRAVEEEVGLKIPAEDAKKIVNYRDLLGHVERQLKAGGRPE